MLKVKTLITTGFALFLANLAPVGAEPVETADQMRSKADEFGRELQLQINQIAKNPPKWQAVSEAPDSFPVPIFKDAKTEFLKNPLKLSAKEKVEFLALRSTESAANISKWYENALGKSGFKLIDSKTSGGAVKLIKSESAELECSVVISEKSGDGFPTRIQLSAIPKIERK